MIICSGHRNRWPLPGQCGLLALADGSHNQPRTAGCLAGLAYAKACGATLRRTSSTWPCTRPLRPGRDHSVPARELAPPAGLDKPLRRRMGPAAQAALSACTRSRHPRLRRPPRHSASQDPRSRSVGKPQKGERQQKPYSRHQSDSPSAAHKNDHLNLPGGSNAKGPWFHVKIPVGGDA